MATNDLTNKYFIKNTLAGTYADFATLFDGLRILRIDGFLAQGQSKNVYTASWEYEDEEDFAIVMQDDSDAPRIIHESTDINITFIIRQKYATGVIDVHTQHKKFIEYMTEKDVWIKNSYNNNLVAHCVCLKEYSPTTEKYQRGSDSWVMGTITLHKLTSNLYHEFALTTSLIGCTSDLPPVITNEKLFATITPLSGHQQLPWNTKVTMGGADITAEVYDKATGAVSIPSVTGDISIEAEAVVITGGYQPIEWIKKLVHGRYFDLGYAANVHTEIELDITIPSRANQCVINQTGASASGVGTNEPAFVFRALSTSNPPRYGTMKLGDVGWGGSSHPTPPKDERLIVRMGDLKASYKYPDGTLISSNTWDADTVFEGEVASNIWLFAASGTSNGGFFGEIYRVRHYESGVLVHDYIPVKYGEEYGLYEIKTGEALLKADTVVTGSDVANTSNSLQSTNEEEM